MLGPDSECVYDNWHKYKPGIRKSPSLPRDCLRMVIGDCFRELYLKASLLFLYWMARGLTIPSLLNAFLCPLWSALPSVGSSIYLLTEIPRFRNSCPYLPPLQSLFSFCLLALFAYVFISQEISAYCTKKWERKEKNALRLGGEKDTKIMISNILWYFLPLFFLGMWVHTPIYIFESEIIVYLWFGSLSFPLKIYYGTYSDCVLKYKIDGEIW